MPTPYVSAVRGVIFLGDFGTSTGQASSSLLLGRLLIMSSAINNDVPRWRIPGPRRQLSSAVSAAAAFCSIAKRELLCFLGLPCSNLPALCSTHPGVTDVIQKSARIIADSVFELEPIEPDTFMTARQRLWINSWEHPTGSTIRRQEPEKKRQCRHNH